MINTTCMSYIPVVPWKTIPDSRLKWTKSIPIFRRKQYKNPTLCGGTYLYGLYNGVLPPPPPSAARGILKGQTHKLCCIFVDNRVSLEKVRKLKHFSNKYCRNLNGLPTNYKRPGKWLIRLTEVQCVRSRRVSFMSFVVNKKLIILSWSGLTRFPSSD